VPREHEVVITAYRDGPLLVRGPVQLAGPDGEMFTPRRETIALCRCGKSRLRPLCDGTHKLIGFRAPGANAVSEPPSGLGSDSPVRSDTRFSSQQLSTWLAQRSPR
jgi:CDGSH-type Zn-finger protein